MTDQVDDTQISGNHNNSTTKVFVYGTLKTGLPNHHLLTNIENGIANYICTAKTVTKYPLVVGTEYNIPFLLNKPGTGHQVSGEVYAVDGKMLKVLDGLEYVGILYDYLSLIVMTDEDEEIECTAYALNNSQGYLSTLTMLDNYDEFKKFSYTTSKNSSLKVEDLVRLTKIS